MRRTIGSEGSRGRLLGAAVLTAALVLSSCGDGREPAGQATVRQATEPPRKASAPSNGFNDEIAWRALDEGLTESATTGRPLMLLVHASWCSRCKALKPAFHDLHLADLSQRFVMVNVDQDAVPASLAYAPDGTYIPRIVFLSPETGEVDETLRNPTRGQYHYFYQPSDDLVGTMKRALERYGKS